MDRTIQNVSLSRKRHWFVVAAAILLSPILGYLLSEDRGLLFGAVVGLLAALWLLWPEHKHQ